MISREIAEQEVSKWLNLRGTSQKKREKFQDNIDNLVDAFEEGVLELNEDGTIVQKLQFPVGEGGGVKTLTLKPRLTVGEINTIKQGNKVKAGDGDNTVLAYIAAITEKPFNLLYKLDISDYNISQNVAVFFL